MRSDRRSLLLSAALTLLGAVLLQFYLNADRERVAGGPARQVVVFTQDLPAGAVLSSDQLTTRALPSAYVESRHVMARDLVDIVGTALALPARAGESVLWSDLSSMRSGQRQLSALIPKGMRAVTLALEGGAFNTLLRPGDRVDVMLVAAISPEDDDSIAQNLLVLAVGHDLGGDTGGRSQRAGGQVALAVTLDQGRRLAHAERRGKLRLLLRNPEDVAPTRAGADPRQAG